MVLGCFRSFHVLVTTPRYYDQAFITQQWFVLSGFHCTNNACTGFCFWGFLERIVCGLFIEKEVRDLCMESMYNNWRSCQ